MKMLVEFFNTQTYDTKEWIPVIQFILFDGDKPTDENSVNTCVNASLFKDATFENIANHLEVIINSLLDPSYHKKVPNEKMS